MIIDAHTHVWPDRVAARALAGSVPDLERRGDGTVAGLSAAMQAAGIDRAVCLGVANTPDRLDAANAFAASLPSDRFIGFGSVHAGASAETNVESLQRHGLAGAKVHPLFQDYGLDDPGLWDVLDAMQEVGLAAIVHVGAGADDATNARCTPPMLVQLVERFPRLKLIACHFGGYRLLEEAADLIVGRDVYLDTSWPPGLRSLGAERVRRLIDRHGPGRIVFASDWPMADPAAEVDFIASLGLPKPDLDGILGENLLELLQS